MAEIFLIGFEKKNFYSRHNLTGIRFSYSFQIAIPCSILLGHSEWPMDSLEWQVQEKGLGKKRVHTSLHIAVQ